MAAIMGSIATASTSLAADFVLPKKCTSGATGDGTQNLSDSFPPVVIAYGLKGDKPVSLRVGEIYPMSDNANVWVANINYNPFSVNGGFNVEVAYTPVFVTFERAEPPSYGIQAITLPRPDQPSSDVAGKVTLTVYAADKDDDGSRIPGAFVELRPLAAATDVSLPSALTMEADEYGNIELHCVSFRQGDVYATVYDSSNDYAYDSEVSFGENGHLYVEPGGGE
ncbi:hypothetical protein [Nitrincola sp.]